MYLVNLPRASSRCLKGVPIAFLTNLGTFRMPVTQVADQNSLLFRMQVRNSSRTGFDTCATGSAFFVVDQNCTSLATCGQRVHRASLDAWIVFTLNAEMWHFCTWNEHENSNSRGFWPDSFLMMERACNFAFSATAALQKISSNPDTLRHK